MNLRCTIAAATRSASALVLATACAATAPPSPDAPTPAEPPTPTLPAATPQSPPPAQDYGAFEVQVSGEGPAVIVIPGLTCGAHVWDATVKRFADRYQFHVLTLSGFAGRPAMEGPMLPQVRDAIVRYADEHALVRPAVMGHSLGGFLAFWLAATEPNRFGPIIAVDGLPSLAAISGLSPDGVAEAAAATRAQMSALSPEDFAAGTAQALAAQIVDPEDVAWVAPVSGRSDPAAVGQAMEELLLRDLRPQMADVRSPVLLLANGAGDETQRQRTEALYRDQVRDIADHQVVQVRGARHFVMLDKPTIFFAAVEEFLAAHPPGGPRG